MNYTVFACFMIWAMIMMASSSWRGDLTKHQMLAETALTGYSCGSHTGIWSNLLLLPWLAGIIATYHNQWSSYHCILLGVMSLILTFLMHVIWSYGGPLDHNIASQGKLTLAGWLHMIFMWAMLTLVVLFYFATENIRPEHLTWISILLVIHIALSTTVLEWRRQGHPTLMGIGTNLAFLAILIWRVIWISS